MNTPLDEASRDSPVLVVVLNNPEDLQRAQTQGWYRVPLLHAPQRIGADFLAFYQTGAFPPAERWCVRWAAAVRGYHLATRRELIPEEPDHPRADARYYRIALGGLFPLAHPIPSRRLRRITFIRTTVRLLCEATEINDLWIRTRAQERMWQALQHAGLAGAAEHEYLLVDDLPYNADFAVLLEDRRIAIFLTDGDLDQGGCLRERVSLDYSLARGDWQALFVDTTNAGSIAESLSTLLQQCKVEPEAL